MRPSETVICGLFGWPVGHSISPEIHNAAFAAAGLDWSYRSFPVRPEELPSAFREFQSRGGRGLNITIPHKVAVIELLDRLEDRARLIGAVNTVLFQDGSASGFNTDGPGFIRAVEEEWGFSFSGKSVVLFGAGGAGRAVAVSAVLEGSRLAITDLDRDRAEGLSGWINREIRPEAAAVFAADTASGERVIAAADLAVDATPLGLDPSDPPAFDPGLLSPAASVVDLVYNPPETPLLRAARRRGLKTLGGLGMLIHQAALSWTIWTGLPAPIEAMRVAALRAMEERRPEEG
ncbi:MAG: shikimate dehydrogenase [Candidatus Erginobacter occultus]|nr:shikimate dehydrogenase [Candidatus Erginobacter occultus]